MYNTVAIFFQKSCKDFYLKPKTFSPYKFWFDIPLDKSAQSKGRIYKFRKVSLIFKTLFYLTLVLKSFRFFLEMTCVPASRRMSTLKSFQVRAKVYAW